MSLEDDLNDLSLSATAAADREEEICEFYLDLCRKDDVDAEIKTCEKFGIDEQSLMFILEADLINSMIAPL